MAIQINTTLTAKSKLTIPSGSVVTFSTNFPDREKMGQMSISLWKDVADVDTGIIGEVEEFPDLIILEYTKAEMLALTFVKVQEDLKDYLENILGVGTCTIIDLLTD
jgi:hypothetical protein